MVKRFLVSLAVLGLLAGPAAAKVGNLNVTAAVAQAITITEDNPVDFGLVAADMVANDLCTLLPSTGIVDCPGGPTVLSQGALGLVTITGTANQLISFDITESTEVAPIKFMLPRCQTPNLPGDNVCSGGVFADTLDGGGSLTVEVGGTLQWTQGAVAPGAYVIPVVIAANYL